MNVNPMQLIQLIRSGSNPQQLIMNILQNQGRNNPILQNVADLAQKGDMSTLEMIGRNLAQQRGLDFDKEFEAFKNSLNQQQQ
jgi:hypothetical protein